MFSYTLHHYLYIFTHTKPFENLISNFATLPNTHIYALWRYNFWHVVIIKGVVEVPQFPGHIF